MKKLLTALTMLLLVSPVYAFNILGGAYPCQPCEYDHQCADVEGDFEYHCIRGRCQTHDFSEECKNCGAGQDYGWTCVRREDKVVSVHKICKSTGYGFTMDEKVCVIGCDEVTGLCIGEEDEQRSSAFMQWLAQNAIWVVVIGAVAVIVWKKDKLRL